MGEGSVMQTDPYHTPTIIQPLTSQPQKTQKPRRLKRKDTEIPQPSGLTTNVADEAINQKMDDHLVRAATTASSLEAKQDSGNIDKTQSRAIKHIITMFPGIVQGWVPESSGDEEDLGEDASKQGRRIHDIDVDEDITLVNDDNEMFDVEPSVFVSAFSASTKDSAATTTTATIPTPRKGIVFQEPGTTTTTISSLAKASHTNFQDKGKGKMVEPKQPIKKKELIRLDEEIDSKLQAEFDKEAKIKADHELAQRLQSTRVKAFKRVNTFVDFRTDLVEGSSKRAGTELEQEQLMLFLLATKPPSIVDWKSHKEGKKTYYQIIRADGSSKMYLVFSYMLKSFDREDLETLWKLVKAKHGSTRPEEGYERVL
ncbi:hypothetical protein Tco_1467534 [Tanacetum coccineum]